MARLTRATQKIFAGSATNNGVFGSLQAGKGQLSNDVETIQSLPAYEQGWNAATVSSELLPPLEEFQGLQYASSYQLAYILQDGIPEWDAGTTYYAGSTCKVISGSDFTLYKSLIDNNINNTPSSSPSQWAEIFNTANGVQSLSNLSQTLDDSTEKYPSNKAVKDAVGDIFFPVGSLIPFAGNVTPSGWLLCDGSAVSRTTYADLFAAIGTTYGAGDGTTTFNLPNGTLRLLSDTVPVVGNGITIGLTDGSTNVGMNMNIAYGLSALVDNYGKPVGSSIGGGITAQETLGLTTDATKSGMIADLSATEINLLIKY